MFIVSWSYLTSCLIHSSVTQAATQREEAEITKAPAAASNLVAGLRVPRQRRPNPQYIGPEWIA